MYNHELMSEVQDALGLTNRDIAHQTNISEATISRYMSGCVKEPNVDILADICYNALNLSLDVVMGRNVLTELPVAEGQTMTENLRILRDIISRNSDRIRSMEHEKDSISNQHLDHLKEQLDKYSASNRRYNTSIFVLIALCGILFGIIVAILANNPSVLS